MTFRSRLLYVPLLLFWLCPVSLWAQTEVLTLEACREKARAHYPAIALYGVISQAEQYNVKNAALARVPQVHVGAQASWQTDAVRFPEELSRLMAEAGTPLGSMAQDHYRVHIDVEQSLYDGGESSANMKMAQAQAKEQQHQLDVQFHQLQSRVDDLFFGILLLNEQEKQMQQMMALLEQNLELVRSLVRNQAALQSEAHAVEAELLAAGQQVQQIKASQEAYKQMLSLLIGEDLQTCELAKPVPFASSWRAYSVAQNASGRPEWQVLEAQGQLLGARESLIRSGARPHLMAFVNGWYGYPGLNMFENMRNQRWSLNAIVGIRLKWNIGNLVTKQYQLDQVQLAHKQVAIQKETFTFNNNLSVVQQEGEMERLQKALESDDRIVELRKSVREAAQSQWRNGTITATQLLQKITDEHNARSARAVHEIEWLKKSYELQHTLTY